MAILNGLNLFFNFYGAFVWQMFNIDLIYPFSADWVGHHIEK